MRLFREGLAWVVFAAAVGLLSVWPRYELVEPGDAILSITFSHAARRIGECRRLTQEELDKLPPNMRKPAECPRERHTVRIEVRSGEDVLYSDVLPPSGIWSDGKANIYHRVMVSSGTHELFIGMNDSGADNGFDYITEKRLEIEPGRNVVIQFDTELQQFTIH